MKKAIVMIQNCLVFAGLLTVGLAGFLPAAARAEENLGKEVQAAISLFKKTDSKMEKFFNTAAGYVVFPSVAKGGAGLGGAHGKGEVFAKGSKIGEATLTQFTIGFQLGGQVYSEVIFFQTEASLEDFKLSKMKLSAQAGAVAAAEGVSENARYSQGVAIFTMVKSGLMFEGSVGGQKFTFIPTQ